MSPLVGSDQYRSSIYPILIYNNYFPYRENKVVSFLIVGADFELPCERGETH